jgi:putative transposase
MPNHYHLLLQTPRANLSDAVGWFQTNYSVRFNRRHRRSGHLYQGRFKAHLVEADAYARQLVKYIHLNSVRPSDKKKPIPAGRAGALETYPWSSRPAYAGRTQAAPPEWLCLDWLSYFGRTRRVAQTEYRREMAAAFGEVLACQWTELRQGMVLGGESFWNRARQSLEESAGEEEIRWRRRADRDEMLRCIAAWTIREADWHVALWLQVRVGGQRMTELAKEYGYRDGSSVHRVVQRLEQAAQADPVLAAHLKQLADRVSSVKS